MYSNCELEVGLQLLNKLDVLEVNTVIHRNLAIHLNILSHCTVGQLRAAHT